MAQQLLRLVHVDHEFCLSGDGIPPHTSAYAHAAVMRALMRVRDLCSEEVLAKIPGIENHLAAIVLNQHEQYSQLALLDPHGVDDENELEKKLQDLRKQHKILDIKETDQSKRIFPRYHTKFDLHFEKLSVTARCNNVSLDGLCATVATTSALPMGEIQKVSLLGKSRQIHMQGHIAWAFNNGKQTVAGIALKFTEAESMTAWLGIIKALHLRQYPQQRSDAEKTP